MAYSHDQPKFSLKNFSSPLPTDSGFAILGIVLEKDKLQIERFSTAPKKNAA